LVGGRPDDEFAIGVQPQYETRSKDIEQCIMAPIYVGPDRLIVEFIRAEILWCKSDGTQGVRLAAIDPATGQAGTSHSRIDPERYQPVLDRCRGQLQGDALLFPPRHDLHRRANRIPRGVPELTFDAKP
jgi:hypothetical protein